jgi:hypothetical protein
MVFVDGRRRSRSNRRWSAKRRRCWRNLRGARERTRAFLEETSGRDVHKYRLPHPFLRSLNA